MTYANTVMRNTPWLHIAGWLLFLGGFFAAFALVISPVYAQTAKEASKTVLTSSSTDVDLGANKHLLTLYSVPVRTYNGSAWLDFVKTDYVDGYTIGYTEIDKNEYIWVTNITNELARVCMNVTAQNDNIQLPLTKTETKESGSVSNTAFYKLRTGETYCVWTDITNMKVIKFGEHSTTISINPDNSTWKDSAMWEAGPSGKYGMDGTITVRMDDAGDYREHSVFSFIMPADPGSAVIQEMKVEYYLYDGSGSVTNIETHETLEAWLEGDVSWNQRTNTTAWTNAGALNNTSSAQTVISNLTFNTTSGSQYYPWYLIGGTANSVTNNLTSCTWGKQCNVTFYPKDFINGGPYLNFYSRNSGTSPPRVVITYTTGGDTTPPSPVYILPSANNTFTQNASYVYVNVDVGEAPGNCTLQNGTVNLSASVGGNYCYYNITGQGNNTVLDFRMFANDLADNHNWSAWRRATINLTSVTGCTVTLANTTITNHANISCNTSDLLTLNWSWTQWDTEVCGTFNNITWYNYSYQACDYCQYNLTNTTASAPENTTAVYTNVTACNTSGNLTQYVNWTQWSWWVRFDTNATTCCGVTGLGSDCVNNVTYYDNLTWGNYSTLTCAYSPPSPKTVCSVKPMLIFRENEDYEFDIGWVFDC